MMMPLSHKKSKLNAVICEGDAEKIMPSKYFYLVKCKLDLLKKQAVISVSF